MGGVLKLVKGRDLLADVRPASVTVADWSALPEPARMEALRNAACPPSDVGPVPVAPGRGAFKVVTPFTVTDAGWRVPCGHDGRRRVERADTFDRMADHARKMWLRKHKDIAGFVPPFEPGHEEVGRYYGRLCERHAAGGMRCASLEAGVDGSRSGGSFIDAYVAEGIEIDGLRFRIGTGAALALRRVRPSARGRMITDRELVDSVCWHDMTLAQVLDSAGWPYKGSHVERLREALVAALDRMRGHGLRRPQYRG
jgi:hypothetical protein